MINHAERVIFTTCLLNRTKSLPTSETILNQEHLSDHIPEAGYGLFVSKIVEVGAEAVVGDVVGIALQDTRL